MMDVVRLAAGKSMSKGNCVRICMIAVGATALILGAATPALAGKGAKKQVPGGMSAPNALVTVSVPQAPKAPKAPAAKSSQQAPASRTKGTRPGKSAVNRAKPAKVRPSGKARGRALAKGHHKRQAKALPSVAARSATKAPARSGPARSGPRVLGLTVASPPDSAFAGPALFQRPPGEVLPFTGGDIAAMLFLGLMVITIGGLIWRAPSLIDKPRRSQDLSI